MLHWVLRINWCLNWPDHLNLSPWKSWATSMWHGLVVPCQSKSFGIFQQAWGMMLTMITGVVPRSICGTFNFKMPHKTLVGKSGPATKMHTFPRAKPHIRWWIAVSSWATVNSMVQENRIQWRWFLSIFHAISIIPTRCKKDSPSPCLSCWGSFPLLGSELCPRPQTAGHALTFLPNSRCNTASKQCNVQVIASSSDSYIGRPNDVPTPVGCRMVDVEWCGFGFVLSARMLQQKLVAWRQIAPIPAAPTNRTPPYK